MTTADRANGLVLALPIHPNQSIVIAMTQTAFTSYGSVWMCYFH